MTQSSESGKDASAGPSDADPAARIAQIAKHEGVGEAIITDILQIPVPIRAMVSLLGRRHNKMSPRTYASRCPGERSRGSPALAALK